MVPIAAALLASCGGDAAELSRLDPPPPEAGAVRIEPGDLPPSYMTVPVEVSIELLRDLLDAELPTTMGSLDERIGVPDRDRLDIAYALERGPVEVHVDERGALVGTTLEYGVRAWYDPPVLPEVSASCGTDPEQPRPRLHVVLRSPLQLDREWIIRSSVAVEEVRPASDSERDRCEVTFLGVDVTGRVVEGARSALRGVAGQVDELVASVDVRSDFEGWWRTIAAPIRLADGVWLVLDPLRVGRAGIVGDEARLGTVLTLVARPRIVLGDRPVVEPRGLPPVDSILPPAEEISVAVEAVATYGEVTRRIREAVAGRRFEAQGRTIRVENVGIDGLGDGRVSVRVELAGDVEGVVYLVGTPTYDAEDDEIHVDDLDFDVRTRDRLVAGAAWVAQAGLVPAIRDAARLPAAAIREWARGKVDEGFNATISSQVRLEGRAGAVAIEEVRAGPDDVRVRVRVRGRARLIVSPSASSPSVTAARD
jgi:hypothetical protein